MTERSKKFRAYVVDELNNAGVRKSLLYDMIGTSLAETRNTGMSKQMRRAKVTEYLYDHIGLTLHPYEKLIGSQLALYPVDDTLPDYEQRKQMAREHILKFKAARLSGEAGEFGSGVAFLPQAGNQLPTRFALISRDHYEANIPFDQLQQIIHELQEEFKDDEILVAPEIGREVEVLFNYYYEEPYRLMNEMGYHTANHFAYDDGKVLHMGYGALRDQARAGLEKAKAEGDAEKADFYQAALITMEAAIRYIYRYADFVEAEAGKTADGERKAQLLEAAARMRRIAEHKAENFLDAMQLLWLTFIMVNIPGGNAVSFGRFDQYMYPFYKHDIDAGVITREEAKEYVMDLWTKVNEPKMRTVISMILAGTTPDGKPGENELTPLCLEVLREMKTPFPNTGIRLRHDSPEWVYDQVIQTLEAGVGQPCIFNDDHWIPILEARGYAPEDARDYYNMGCVEIMIQGKTPNWTIAADLGFPTAIELALYNGEFSNYGIKGLPTGTIDTLDSFEKVQQAVCKQVKYLVTSQCEERHQITKDTIDAMWDPFCSCLMSDPLDRGKDMYHGGCRIQAPWVILGQGLGTAADSLSAIKKFVFDEQLLTLASLKEVLEQNFAGHEDLRIMFDRTTSTFGNDIEEVDEMAKALMDAFFDGVTEMNEKYKAEGISFITSQFSYTMQVSYGEVVGAMPNGRPAREPVSDNAGPSQGKDIGGPTKLVNSMLKKGYEKVTGAYAFNMKFTPSVMKSGNGRAAMKNIIKRYFAGDGPQMQVNYVDSKTLKEAQEDPKKHAGLIVRVAGFCEYFANLDRQLQNEIIWRTEQGM